MMSRYYLLCVQLVALCLISTALSNPLDNLQNAEQGSDEIQQLLDQLKYLSSSKDTKVENVLAPEGPEMRSPPSKRNCGVNLSNDCGSRETAYMNGLKGFFGNKRRLEIPSPQRTQPSMDRSIRTSARPVQLDDMTGASFKDESIDNLVLKYMVNKLIEDRDRRDEICIKLTGLPCSNQLYF